LLCLFSYHQDYDGEDGLKRDKITKIMMGKMTLREIRVRFLGIYLELKMIIGKDVSITQKHLKKTWMELRRSLMNIVL
jgi:hypothetical protein